MANYVSAPLRQLKVLFKINLPLAILKCALCSEASFCYFYGKVLLFLWLVETLFKPGLGYKTWPQTPALALHFQLCVNDQQETEGELSTVWQTAATQPPLYLLLPICSWSETQHQGEKDIIHKYISLHERTNSTNINLTKMVWIKCHKWMYIFGWLKITHLSDSCKCNLKTNFFFKENEKKWEMAEGSGNNLNWVLQGVTLHYICNQNYALNKHFSAGTLKLIICCLINRSLFVLWYQSRMSKKKPWKK